MRKFLIVTGAAGSGKTRLANWIMDALVGTSSWLLDPYDPREVPPTRLLASTADRVILVCQSVSLMMRQMPSHKFSSHDSLSEDLANMHRESAALGKILAEAEMVELRWWS